MATFEDYLSAKADGLLRYATAVAADAYVAEDVVQSVLERAYPRWAQISALEYPDAYLRRMVITEFVSLRRRIGHVFTVARVPEPAEPVDPSDHHTDRQALLAELRRLPNRQRAAIALRYWEGLTDAEIAEQLGCRETTVRGYIWRGLRTLRVGFSDPRQADQLTSLTPRRGYR
jgi:RNA polymerase sigma-70 factor (sigma-E family)